MGSVKKDVKIGKCVIVFSFMSELYGGFDGIKLIGKSGYVDVVRVDKKGVINVSIVGGIGRNDALEGTCF